MAGLPPTQAELITRALESRVADIYTAGPGIVQAYYPDSQTADILPGVKRAIGTLEDDTVYEDLPIVPNVKVCFPRGGAFQITWPLNPGDSVILLSTHFGLGQWRQGDNSQTVEPGDLRLHSLGSSLALPMLAIDSAAVANAQASQNAFIIAGPLIVLGDPNTTDYAPIARLVDANFKTVHDAITGATPVPNDGGAALKAAILAALTFQATACQSVKLK